MLPVLMSFNGRLFIVQLLGPMQTGIVIVPAHSFGGSAAARQTPQRTQPRQQRKRRWQQPDAMTSHQREQGRSTSSKARETGSLFCAEQAWHSEYSLELL